MRSPHPAGHSDGSGRLVERQTHTDPESRGSSGPMFIVLIAFCFYLDISMLNCFWKILLKYS